MTSTLEYVLYMVSLTRPVALSIDMATRLGTKLHVCLVLAFTDAIDVLAA